LYGLANASADVIVFISALNKYSPKTAAPALVPPLSYTKLKEYIISFSII
jgi:hypothetical protein